MPLLDLDETTKSVAAAAATYRDLDVEAAQRDSFDAAGFYPSAAGFPATLPDGVKTRLRLRESSDGHAVEWFLADRNIVIPDDLDVFRLDEFRVQGVRCDWNWDAVRSYR